MYSVIVFAAIAAAAGYSYHFHHAVHRLAPGGDLLHRLNRQNCGYFTVPIARFVIAQVILALEYMHGRGIVRDYGVFGGGGGGVRGGGVIGGGGVC